MNSNKFLNRYPSIDLHGFDKETSRVVINDFINDNIFLKNEIIVIIHGLGSGKRKKAVHDILKVNKNVIEYKTDNFNSGYTIVKLRMDSKINVKKEFGKKLNLESKQLDYLYYLYDKKDSDVDENYIAKVIGDWILGLYRSNYLYAVLNFNNIKDNNYIWDMVIQVLEYFLQLVDYKIDKEEYKINIYKKYDELLVGGIIKKLDIRYFFGLFRYSIDFKDKNVFVIHSPNGCGKTNLLEIINNLFRADNNFVSKNYVDILDRLKKDIDNKTGRKIDLNNEFFDKIEFTIQNDSVNNEFILYRKENEEQIYIRNKEKNKSSFVGDVGCIYFKNLQFSDVVEIIYLLKNLHNKDDIIEKNVKRFNEIMKVFFCFEKSVELNLNVLKNVLVNSNSDTININSSNIFDIRYKEKNIKNIPGVFKYNQQIDFDLLSTGEKNIIRIFFKLIFGTRYGSFILLDEPEISLHIEWQALLIKNIVKLAEENDFKFLIATHSPYIADNSDVVVGRAIDEY